MAVAKKVANAVIGGLLVVGLVGVFAWFTVPKLLGLHGEVVLSGSMEPALPTGSVVFVEHTRPEDIKPGDIMMFGHPLKPPSEHVIVTHRVTEITRDANGNLAFKTKGDANENEDPWTVTLNYVLGTAKHDVPYIGYVTSRLRTPLGVALLIVVPGTYLAADEIRKLVRLLRDSRQQPSTPSTQP